jgi:hypothetical protein
MTKKTKSTGKFKSKAATILSNQKSRPDCMEDFLKNTQLHKNTTAQLHENTEPKSPEFTNEDLHKRTNYQLHRTAKTQKEELGRLHVQIRQELLEKLLDTVFRRKRDHKIKNRSATQRAVIEEALETYFMQDSVM